MVEISFDELVAKIIQASGLSKEAILARINSKVIELSGLVSKKGAAHIIASNFGIKLHESLKGKSLALKDVVSGLNNISVKGIITKIFPINEFEHNGRKGRVGSLIINDGTAEARLVFWNEASEIINSGKININDFIKIHHLRSKKGNYGMELHLTNRSRIELNPNEERPIIKSINKPGPSLERYNICDLQEGINVEIKGCLVNIYDKKLFYDSCPECGRSVKDNKCNVHGEIKPVKSLIVNAVFDDGTGTIRCVFFRKQAEILLGHSTEKVIELINQSDNKFPINEKLKLLGEEYILSGKVIHNNFTDNLELMVNSISLLDSVKEIKLILGNDKI